MSQDATAKDEAAPSAGPYDAAAASLRDAAKWLLGAFAAVGAVFAAGLQLASIGDLGLDDLGRLIAAVLGMVFTVGAIAWAIYAVSEVLTRRLVTLSLLATDQDFATEVEALNEAPELLGGIASVKELLDSYTTTVAQEKESRVAYDTATQAVKNAGPAPDPIIATGLLRTQTEAESAWRVDAERALALDRIRLELLSVAGFLRLSRAYQTQRRTLCIAAGVAALGIAVFAWGANPPAPESAGTSEVLPATPSTVNVTLKEPNADTKTALGTDCDVSKQIPAIAMTVTGQTYQVATLQSATCQSVWLEITVPDDGAVTARAEKAD